jgi:hypothetical protein
VRPNAATRDDRIWVGLRHGSRSAAEEPVELTRCADDVYTCLGHVSADTAAERIVPTTGALEVIDQHSCCLRTGSISLDELAIYVPGKGFQFQVQEPGSLSSTSGR